MNNVESSRKKNCLFVIAFVLIAFIFGFLVGSIFRQNANRKMMKKIDNIELLKELAGDDKCYVIGHKSPDTDTVCSAMILADYLKEYGIDCEAVVSGKINNETRFILEHFDIEIPSILDKADGKKFILVDHSEYMQSIDGMENAEVIAIFDHHSTGTVRPNKPIVYNSLNVGATATILYRVYKISNLKISKKAAYLIASSILSDTANLTTSTTTEMDRIALDGTSKIAGIKNIAEFYEKMEKAAMSYDGMTDEEIFKSDYKEYDMDGVKVGIACINALDENESENLKERMEMVINKNAKDNGIKNTFIVIKNAKDNQSKIFGFGDGASEIIDKAFGQINATFIPPASRKKDIVPKLQEVYQSLK